MTDEEVDRRCENWRDDQFAHLVSFAFCLACKSHPDLMRQALAALTDLKGLQESAERIALIVSDSQAKAARACEMIQSIHHNLDEIEDRIDSLHRHLEETAVLGARHGKEKSSTAHERGPATISISQYRSGKKNSQQNGSPSGPESGDKKGGDGPAW